MSPCGKGFIVRVVAVALAAVVAGCDDGGTAHGGGGRSKSPPAWARSDSTALPSRDPEYGKALYSQTCITCHGPRGHGMPKQGTNLRSSKFIAEHTDEQIVAFLRQGRLAEDPENQMGILMPARGGNQALDDASLANIVAFLRQVQIDALNDTEEEEAIPEIPGATTQPLVESDPRPL